MPKLTHADIDRRVKEAMQPGRTPLNGQKPSLRDIMKMPRLERG